jgi:hypothetical protein
MKKYNMIENRKDLSHEDVEKGMDFNKILQSSNAIKKSRFKMGVIVSSILCVMIVGIFFFLNTIASVDQMNHQKQNTAVSSAPSEVLVAETYSLFIGSKVAKGDVAFTLEEIKKVKAIDVKSSSSTSNYKLMSFTFTTLTKNGISQINAAGNLFNAEMTELLKSVKVGQTLYLENIILQDRDGKQNKLEPITISIK